MSRDCYLKNACWIKLPLIILNFRERDMYKNKDHTLTSIEVSTFLSENNETTNINICLKKKKNLTVTFRERRPPLFFFQSQVLW